MHGGRTRVHFKAEIVTITLVELSQLHVPKLNAIVYFTYTAIACFYIREDPFMLRV